MSDSLLEQIKEQGDLVRKLKAAKEPAARVNIQHFEQIYCFG